MDHRGALRAIAAPETRRNDQRIHPEGLTFDDVCSCPANPPYFPPTPTRAPASRRKLALNIPLASAAMDTVTESRLAIAIARQGGIGNRAQKHALSTGRAKKSTV